MDMMGFENYGEFRLQIMYDSRIDIVTDGATAEARAEAKREVDAIVAVMRDRGEPNWPEKD